jgi:hypothetical protein
VRRLIVLLGAVAAAAALLAAPAFATSVHIRVEGATRTLFGPTEPVVEPFLGQLPADGGTVVELASPTPLGALEAASRQGEFFYRLKALSFGPFVDQVGRYPGTGTSGWVYKVNGVSPPVGAADYQLKDGDTVLWYYATFGDAGGPPTLALAPRTRSGSRRCFAALAVDDAGTSTAAHDVVYVVGGRRVPSADGRLCVAKTVRALRATKAGAVPSRVVDP